MDKDKRRKDEWISVASKSHPGRFYLFNKVTGETQWLPLKENQETKDTNRKSPPKLSINKVSKTPAQDRLKRLQHSLKVPQTKAILSHSKRSSTAVKEKTPKEQENESNDGPSTSSKAKSFAKSPKKETKRVHANEADNSAVPCKLAAIEKPQKCDLPESSKVSKVNSSTTAFNKSLPVATFSDSSHSSKESTIKNNLTSIEKPKSSKLNNLRCGIVKKIKEICKIPFNASKKLADEQLPKHKISALKKTTNFKATSRNGVSKRLLASTTREAIIDQIKDEKTKTPENKIPSANIPKVNTPTNQKIPAYHRGSVNTSEVNTPTNQKIPLYLRGSANTPEVNTPTNQKTPSYPRGSANLRLERLKHSLLSQQQSCDTKNDSITSTITRNAFTETNSKITELLQEKDSIYDTSATDLTNFSNNTTHSAINDEVEAMDWQPSIEETSTEPTLMVERSKKCLLKDNNENQTMGDIIDTVNENLLRISAEKQNDFGNNNKKWHKDFYYFILDTNVLLKDLTFVEDLSKMKLCDTKGSILYIPYSVLQELDKLKMRSGCQEGVKTLAVRAIKYLNSKFENNSSHVQAQSALDERYRLVDISSADDSIMNCCLQAKEHVPNLLLLTEDINLRNKAMCNNIMVSTKSDLLAKRIGSSYIS